MPSWRRARCDAYGLGNVKVETVAPAKLLDAVRATPAADVYILYAVLEHQTWSERLETLHALWTLLPPGGWLAVVETPNRLAWSDRHSSKLDFHHLLPDDLAFAYLDRCPQNAYRMAMSQALRASNGGAGLARIRWGLGASFHEFQLGLDDDLLELVWADGTEREMTAFFPDELDDLLLRRFFEARVPDVPIGFSRAVLNVILRRPRSPDDRVLARRRNEERRRPAEVVATAPVARSPPPPSLREIVGRTQREFFELVQRKLKR